MHNISIHDSNTLTSTHIIQIHSDTDVCRRAYSSNSPSCGVPTGAQIQRRGGERSRVPPRARSPPCAYQEAVNRQRGRRCVLLCCSSTAEALELHTHLCIQRTSAHTTSSARTRYYREQQQQYRIHLRITCTLLRGCPRANIYWYKEGENTNQVPLCAGSPYRRLQLCLGVLVAVSVEGHQPGHDAQTALCQLVVSCERLIVPRCSFCKEKRPVFGTHSRRSWFARGARGSGGAGGVSSSACLP